MLHTCALVTDYQLRSWVTLPASSTVALDAGPPWKCEHWRCGLLPASPRIQGDTRNAILEPVWTGSNPCRPASRGDMPMWTCRHWNVNRGRRRGRGGKPPPGVFHTFFPGRLPMFGARGHTAWGGGRSGVQNTRSRATAAPPAARATPGPGIATQRHRAPGTRSASPDLRRDLPESAVPDRRDVRTGCRGIPRCARGGGGQCFCSSAARRVDPTHCPGRRASPRAGRRRCGRRAGDAGDGSRTHGPAGGAGGNIRPRRRGAATLPTHPRTPP